MLPGQTGKTSEVLTLKNDIIVEKEQQEILNIMKPESATIIMRQYEKLEL